MDLPNFARHLILQFIMIFRRLKIFMIPLCLNMVNEYYQPEMFVDKSLNGHTENLKKRAQNLVLNGFRLI